MDLLTDTACALFTHLAWLRKRKKFGRRTEVPTLHLKSLGNRNCPFLGTTLETASHRAPNCLYQNVVTMGNLLSHCQQTRLGTKISKKGLRSDHVAPAVLARLLPLWYQFFQMPGAANLLPQNKKKGEVKTASAILKNLAAAKVDLQKKKNNCTCVFKWHSFEQWQTKNA